MKPSLDTEQQTAPSFFSPLILLAFFGFVVIGISGSASGVLLPSLGDYYHVDKAVIGLLFLVSSIGYFLSAFASGMLVERLGTRGFLLLGTVLMLIGEFAFGLKPLFLLVLLARLSLGLGVGIVETGLNIYVSMLPRSATLLNYLHAFYGVGALIGPLIASTLLILNLGWNSMYLLLAVLSIPLLLGFWFFFRSIAHNTPEEERQTQGNTLKATLRMGVIRVASLFLLFYVGVEVSMGNWSYTYLLEGQHLNALLSGWIVSGYWFGLTMGRFVLQNRAERMGISNTTLVYGCMAGILVCIGLIWLVPSEVVAAVSFCLLGFCLGPIYPLMVALTPKLVPARMAASAIGFLVSTSIIGLALFPWLAGVLSQNVGIESLLPYNIALTLVMLGLWWSLFHKGRDRFIASSSAIDAPKRAR
jgi:fucose permease